MTDNTNGRISLIQDNKVFTNDTDVANLFANHFNNVSSDVHKIDSIGAVTLSGKRPTLY